MSREDPPAPEQPEGDAPPPDPRNASEDGSDQSLRAALDALRPSLRPGPGDEALLPPALTDELPRGIELPELLPEPEGSEPSLSTVPPPGLASAVVTRRESPADPGAHTALRAIARRTPPELQRPDTVFGAPDERARAELLEHLAARAEGAARARLLCASAESWQRADETTHARTLYELAGTEYQGDAGLLRELRKYALDAGDVDRAAALLRREAELPLGAQERALVLLLLAELELCRRDDPAAAERAASESFAASPSLSAALMLYTLQVRTQRHHDAAESLRRAADAWPEPRAQSALQLCAARLLLRAGEPVAAYVLCELAHDADPEAIDALLCWTRAARKTANLSAALRALERLERALPTPELRDHARRAHARLLDAADDGHGALALLGTARSLPGMRLRARLAQAQGDRNTQRVALESWAEHAGGSERALALLGLAELELSVADFGAARRALDRATSAFGGSPLLRTMQAALARATGGSAARISAPADANEAERLEAVARLAADARGAAQELALLGPLEGSNRTGATLALDAAAELGDMRRVVDGLAREGHRLADEQQLGVALIRSELCALHDLPDDAGAAAGERRKPRSALGWLQQVHASDDASTAGLAWLEVSALTRGEFAACAATLAGDYLAREGRAREAYERALAAAPGYGPACWALEALLFERDDLPALRRVHAALARNSADPIERATRLLRAAQLAPDEPDDGGTSVWQELAAVSPIDALLCDRELRAQGERTRLSLAEALEGAGHGADGALADLAALRAASGYEDAGEPARAAVLYRALLDRHAGAHAHAALGLERTLAAAGLAALLIERLERGLSTLQSGAATHEALERLALQYAAGGDERRASRCWQALRVLDPTHVPALRAQQRQAMREDHLPELCAAADALARRTRDPRERAAQLRLLARARSLRGEPAPLAIADAADGALGLWHAIELERAARRQNDPQAIAAAVLRLCGYLLDANERASYALRAVDALEQLAPARALEALAPFAEAAPNHPFAGEALARLRQAAGDPAQAAADFERAAKASPAPLRAARLWYRAAALWQDAIGDDARALSALRAVLRIDPLYREAFSRTHNLLTAAGDESALAGLYAVRLAAGGEPQLLAELQVRRARLLLRMGDEAEARSTLAAALELDPQRVDALRAAAELNMTARDFRRAAEVLIQLARVAQDRAVLRDAFFDLGTIYTEHLPDLRRAEIAYTRAVGLDPRDTEALERLLQLFRRKGDHDKAQRAGEQLIALARSEAEIDRRTAELAVVIEESGDTRRAERVLNDRREQTVSSPLILAALADLYARQRDDPALTVHLDRSVHALRSALQQDADDAERWATLSEILTRRGRLEAAACVAELARELGLGDQRGAALAGRHRALGRAALEPAVLERLWPDALTAPMRALLQWLEPRADELLPIVAGRRIQSLKGTLRQASDAARAQLDLPELTLLATSGSECFPVAAKPLTIAIGEPLLALCDAGELTFLLLRAAAVARNGLLAGARSDPAALAALIAAARNLDRLQLDAELGKPAAALRQSLRKQLNPKRQTELQVHAGAVADGVPLRALTLDLGARVALAAGGAFSAGLCALAACAQPEPSADYEEHDPLLALASAAAPQALLAFALSDVYLELLRRAARSSRPGAREYG